RSEDYPVDELLEAVLTLPGTDGAAEVLRGDGRRRVGGPDSRERHALLGEDHLAGLPVLLFHITLLPRHLVIGVHAGGGVDPLDREPLALVGFRMLRRRPRHVRSPG